MRKCLALPLLALLPFASCTKEAVTEVVDNEPNSESVSAVDHSVEPGVAFVEFDDEMLSLIEDDLCQGKIVTRSMELNQALDEFGIKSIQRAFPDAGEFEPRHRKAGLHRYYVVEYADSVPATRASAGLGAIPGVLRAENQRVIVPTSFNDPSLSRQWGLYNASHSNYDINVLPVWNNYTTGDPSVIVAVVDYGIDRTHPDLAANCSSLNYSAIDRKESVDYSGRHGTHVAGIVAAVNNNGVGICGVAGGDAAAGKRGATLMSCEIFRDVTKDGKTVTRNGSSSAAIVWAADHGAVICQNSWAYSYDFDGDGKLNDSEKEVALRAEVGFSDKVAIDYFIDNAGCDNAGNQLPDSPMKGGLVVFAAGNNNIANGAPANYERVLAVSALNSDGSKASYSNYGDFVDLAAPGTSIFSTVPGNSYVNMNGTSMACPHVSGVAALIVSCCGGQGFTNEMLKDKLLKTRRSDIVPAGMGGLVDATAALNYGENLKPGGVDDVNVVVRGNSADISWTSVGNAGGYPAYGYKLICGKDKSVVERADPSQNSVTGVIIRNILAKAKVGETEKLTLTGLDFTSTYYVRVVGYSYVNVYGDSSPAVAFKTVVNHPPLIEGDIAEELILRSHEKKVIPLVITDPDRHTFSVDYKQGSVADSFSGVVKGEATVTIDAPSGQPGTYTATLTATDSYGASTSQDIVYTILENNLPEKIKDAPNQLLTGLGESFSLNLNEYFNDPDGETLKYTVSSGDHPLLRLSINGGRLIGLVKDYGSASVGIKATDAAGTSAEISFKVVARDAAIEYSLYPNPVKDFLNIATGLEMAETRIRIVSQTGRTMFDGSVNASAFEPAQIDLSECSPGVYSGTILLSSGKRSFTIVKR